MKPVGGTDEASIVIDGRPYIPVHINEAGPFWLLLDTGFVGCSVTPKVAERLGLKVDEQGVACLRALAIGGEHWENVKFGVWDEPSIASMLGREFDGFLGNGFLFYVRDTHDLVIDYPGQSLAFLERQARRDSPPAGGAVLIDIRNYYTTVPVRVNDEGPYQFLLDTGASACIVSPLLAQRLGLPRGEPATARGPVDAVEGYRSVVKKLCVGNAALDDAEVIVMDCSRQSGYVGERVDGVLGTTFLAHFAVMLNYRDGIMSVQQGGRACMPAATEGAPR